MGCYVKKQPRGPRQIPPHRGRCEIMARMKAARRTPKPQQPGAREVRNALDLLSGLRASAAAAVALLNDARKILGMEPAVIFEPGLKAEPKHRAAAEKMKREQVRRDRLKQQQAEQQEKNLKRVEKKYLPFAQRKRPTPAEKKQAREKLKAVMPGLSNPVPQRDREQKTAGEADPHRKGNI